MNKKEFEAMIDEKMSSLKKELMKEYLNSLYGMTANKYPNISTPYYYINTDNNVWFSTWNDMNIDKCRFSIGNYFETREEAEFEVERLKVIAELKRFAEPKDRKWNDNKNSHWYVMYDTEEKRIRYEYCWINKRSDIYFESKDEAKKAVEFVGKNRVKKYYLGVEVNP